MLCPKCGKESNNLRVCAFCHTPYPTDEAARAPTPRFTRSVATSGDSRATTSRAMGDPRIAMRRSRIRRRVGIGLLAAFTAGFYFMTRERVIPVGVAVPNLIAAPMSPLEAASLLKTAERTSVVEMHDRELTVRVGAATFPERRDGQLAFAQQYARADELVQRRKRAISFVDPTGNRFARADPEKGVVLTR